MSELISCRVSPELNECLESIAQDAGVVKSALIKDALCRYVALYQTGREDRPPLFTRLWYFFKYNPLLLVLGVIFAFLALAAVVLYLIISLI